MVASNPEISQGFKDILYGPKKSKGILSFQRVMALLIMYPF